MKIFKYVLYPYENKKPDEKIEIKESKLICFSSKERRLYLLETKDLLILEQILGKDN